MDRRIETRVIDTGDAALTTTIEKDACQVWWIVISVKTAGTKGLIQLYDGFDAGGKLQLQVEPEYAGLAPFTPPITCDQGLTIYNDANIACYTVGFRPKKWKAEEG